MTTQHARRRRVSTIGGALFALAVSLGAPITLGASTGAANVRFETLSLENGLSQATVQAILQDHQGFLWFGTQEGLNRYDGYTFKVFRRDPDDGSSLADNWIWALHEGPDGKLWVGTNGGGLSRFDALTSSFTNFPVRSPGADSSQANRVRAIHASDPKTLWVGTDDGLHVFDLQTASFTRYASPGEASGSGGDKIRSIFQDSEGWLWVGTDGNGVIRIDPRSGESRRFRHTPEDRASLGNDRVRCLFEDRQGFLWLGLYDGGIDRLDRRTGAFTHFRHDAENPMSLPNNRVRAILEDVNGNLWVATDGGLGLRDGETGRFSNFVHSAIDPSSLADDRVMALLQDQGGVIWVGTYGGASKWNPLSGVFSHYRDDERTPGRLNGNVVNALAESPDGSLWVASYGVGVNRLDPASGSFELYAHEPDRSGSLSDSRVMSLLADRSGALWVGTMARGLDRLDPKRKKFTNYRHDPNRPGSLSANGVTTIFEDSKGTIWVGTYRGGLNRMDARSGRFTNYAHDPQDSSSLSDNRVLAIYEDRNNELWIGTEDGGLNRFDRRTESFASIRHDPDDPSSLSSDTPWTIYEDRQGALWIGTQGGGLNRWDSRDRDAGRAVFRRYTQKDGLASMSVYGILGDAEGNLWLSSNRGLSRFDPRTMEFRHFDTRDGLQSHEFNFGAYLRGKDGRLHFGGMNGFNSFDPSTVINNVHIPPVVLTGFQRADPDAAPVRITEVEEVDLSYRDYFVTFEFAALDFASPEHNRYMYRLEGFDDDWIDIGANRRATYTNLSSGSYIFRVRGSNNDGVWNEAGSSIRLRVHPPPWGTWWAYTLLGLTVLGLGAIYVRSQRRRLQREANSTRAAEAVSRAKSEFLATMSHELRTPMNGMLGTTELLLQGDLSVSQYRLAQSAQHSAKGLLDIINDVLDFSSIDSGNLELEVVDFDLRNVLHEILQLHAEQAAAKSIDVLLYLPHALPAAFRGDPVRIRQILTNLIGNAIKFTRRGEVTIRVTWEKHDQAALDCRFEIRDTGVGISPDRLGSIFDVFCQADSSMTREYGGTGLGLAISRRLAELMGGEISVESEFGVGSCFCFACRFSLAPLEERALATKADPAGLRALILTDDSATLQILQHHLSDWGVDHVSTGDPTQALEIAHSRADSRNGLDLVIVDDAIAGQGAQKVVEEIESLTTSSRPELLVLSTVGTSGSAPEGPDAGNRICLTKPILAPRLRASLETIAALIPRQVSSEVAPKAAPSRRVLLVDDSALNREICESMLISAGFEVDLANDGSEGVQLASMRNYDAILMDLQMPRMDGFEATRRIRAREESSDGSGRRTWIIALTANATAEDRETSVAAGMDDFVSKPFTQDQLLAALRRAFEGGSGQAEILSPANATDDPRLLTLDYDAVLHRCVGRRELANRMIEKFANSLEGEIAGITDLLKGHSWDEASQAAHKMSGPAGALEAQKLRACLAALERSLSEGQGVDVDVVAAELEKTSSDYRSAVRVMLQEIKQPH